MISNKKLEQIWNLFSKEEPEILLKQFLEVAEDKSLSNIIRSEGYKGAAEVIRSLSGALKPADFGYAYFNKAIELDKDNINARLEICDLFFHPAGHFCTSEREFLENMIYLLNIDINSMNDKYNDEEKKQIENETKNDIKLYFYQRLNKLNENK